MHTDWDDADRERQMVVEFGQAQGCFDFLHPLFSPLSFSIAVDEKQFARVKYDTLTNFVGQSWLGPPA